MSLSIGFFGVEENYRTETSQHDRSYARKLLELIGPHRTVASFSDGTGEDLYLSAIAGKIRRANLDAIICTDENVMRLLVEALPDFKPSFMKNGQRKKLSLNDYHGSFFQVPAAVIGRDRPIDVLILNPLQHLRTVPEARIFAQSLKRSIFSSATSARLLSLTSGGHRLSSSGCRQLLKMLSNCTGLSNQLF